MNIHINAELLVLDAVVILEASEVLLESSQGGKALKSKVEVVFGQQTLALVHAHLL